MLNDVVSRAVIYAAPQQVTLENIAVTAPAPGEALLRALWSGVSRGTEGLVYRGGVPASEYDRMRAPFQAGAFPFPVRYGYAMVGMVEALGEGAPSDLIGRRFFALHPHESRFTLPVSALTPLPDAVPSRRATLAPNLETALNAVWDAGVGPGDRVAIVGIGGVGALLAMVLAPLPGLELLLVDRAPERRVVAEALGAAFATPEAAPQAYEADIVFHASASGAGLATALSLCGLEARLVELSWYGDSAASIPLGGAFHSRRLRLISSQVGQVSPSRRPRWTHARRLAKAVELLADDRYELALGEDCPLEAAPERAADWFSGQAAFGAPTIRYDGAAPEPGGA